MPLAGRKPKPEDQRRNRVKPRHDWRDIPEVPFLGAPSLPPYPGRPRGAKAPEPPRPLGVAGGGLWDEVWRTGGIELIDPAQLLVLCEQMDERVALRFRVLQDPDDWRSRGALRHLDRAITAALSPLSTSGIRTPRTWPSATRRWWRSISMMPHCVLWTEADWQFAIDTASVAAAFHSGDMRWAQELRSRERVLGTTGDARRDLRIRYVPPVDDETEPPATVTTMAAYRRSIEDEA